MSSICLILTAVSIGVLYKTALKQERARLVETAQSQARLIEAVARFDRVYSNDYQQGAVAATLSQIQDAHRNYNGFGKTGEFTLAHLKGEQIVFLLSHRHQDLNHPKPVNISSPLAEPMRRALSGKSGTMISLDYRGETVMAAYEPVGELELGIVAKIDMAEIRAPFIRAAIIVVGMMIFLVGLGTSIFYRVSTPIIRRVEDQNRALKAQVEERKRSEASLQKNEVFLKTLIDAIPIPIFYKDKEGNYIGTNKAMQSFWGKPSSQIIGKNISDIFQAPLAKIHSDADEKVLTTGQSIEYECQLTNAQGSVRDAVLTKAPFTDSTGVIGGIIGATIDITEPRQAEAELKKREQLLEEMGSIAKIGGWEHDLLTDTPTWTKEVYRIVGIDDSGPVPKHEEYLSYYEPESRKALEEAYSAATTNGESFDLELKCVYAKGRRAWIRIMGQPELKDGQCVKMIGTMQDITERKKMEAMIQQSQKMESIGNLAGGVAHDYNNMLSVILGYTEMALEKVDKKGPLYNDLMQVLQAAQRSSDITRQLLAFARRQTIAPKVLDLNNTVTASLKMLNRLIGEDIDLNWQPSANLWPVRIDPIQVDQILANLCVNARDAIPDVGKITIETANVNFDKEYCGDHPGFIPGNYVMLAVSDNGSGIANEIRDKIFDPFFTTKVMGKGTGLGLSTIYGIVKQNQGFINVYSEPGEGTTVKVYLSRHEGHAVEVHRDDTSTAPLGRGETILLVEDENRILKLGQTLLEDIGYKVLSTSIPSEAVKLAREHSIEIKLLITDVVMPEMNGRDLSQRLQKFCTNLRTLYMSGYTANVIVHRGVLDEGVFFLPKPFSKKELAVKVREVLDSDR